MEDSIAHWDDSFGSPVNGLVSVTHSSWVQVLEELRGMSPVVGSSGGAEVLRKIRRQAAGLLHKIEQDFMNCIVKPWVPVRVTPNAYMPVPSAETSKIGVFPLASDPLQWNHLLTGLSAIAELGLDHVVYIVTEDTDHSVSHLPQELRNTVTRSFLSHFSPLLLYSPLGAGYAEDAIDALFRFIALNDRQPMEVYFIPGNAARHPEGSACRDITEEIEEAARKKTYGYDERSHPLSLVLSRKESAWMSCLMSYRHAFVDFPLPEARADEVLTALAENRSREALASLPYSVYEPVRRFLLREEMQPRLPRVMDKNALRELRLPA